MQLGFCERTVCGTGSSRRGRIPVAVVVLFLCAFFCIAVYFLPKINSYQAFAGITSGEDAKFETWVFVDEGGGVLYREILSEGETPTVPATPQKSDASFSGWREVLSDGSGDLLTDSDFSTPIGTLTASKTRTFKAEYQNYLYVKYAEENEEGALIFDVQKYSSGDALDPSSVDFTPPTGYFLAGWTDTIGGTEPISSDATVTEDMTLYPVLKKGFFITYHTDTLSANESEDSRDPTEAEKVAPTFVEEGESPSSASDGGPSNITPERSGYTFGGWYKDEAFTQEWTSSDSSVALSANVDLYAKWIPSTTKYHIVYYLQNRDATGYNYDSTEEVTSDTWESIAASLNSNKYEYFHIDDEKSYQNDTKKAAGSGSTTVNVYYDRNVYRFNFSLTPGSSSTVKEIMGYSFSGTVKGEDSYSFTARYGEYISDNWPVLTDIEGTMYYYNSPYDLDKYWIGWQDQNPISNYSSSYAASGMPRYYVTSDMMPDNDEYKYVDGTTGTSASDPIDVVYKSQYETRTQKYTINCYEGSKKQENVFLTAETQAGYSGYGISWKGIDINGFTLLTTGSVYADSNNVVWFQYERNNYNIELYNADTSSVDTTVSIPYEGNIKSYLNNNEAFTDPEPYKEGYTFGGWYTSPTFNENTLFYKPGGDETNLDSKMPDNNIALYPKWIPTTHTVTFDLNGGTDASGSCGEQTIEDEKTAAEPDPEPTRTNMTFIGWYRENGEPFDFSTPITEDITLIAKWQSFTAAELTYDLNGGTGQDNWTDSSYSIGGEGVVDDMKSGVTAPSGKNDFICWNTEADGSGTNYYPGDSISLNTSRTLYAVWAEKRETGLTFDANGGTYVPSLTTTKSVDFPDYTENNDTIPNSAFTISDDDTPYRFGYEFKGWAESADATEPDYTVGTTIHVNTLGQNTLYAVWEEVEIPITGITDRFWWIGLAVPAAAGVLLALWYILRRRHGLRGGSP